MGDRKTCPGHTQYFRVDSDERLPMRAERAVREVERANRAKAELARLRNELEREKGTGKAPVKSAERCG